MFLKMIQGLVEPSEGSLKLPEEVKIGYVPQIIEVFNSFSGGEGFNRALTQAFGGHPNFTAAG
jgi:hypothetical protein